MCGDRQGRQDGAVLDRVRSKAVTGTVVWLLVVVAVGVVDLLTGPEYGFGFFYLVAVVPAAWRHGRWPGIVVALSSGTAWFIADLVERRAAGVLPIAWNASSRTLMFVMAAVLVDVVRRERVRLRKIDAERSQFMRVLEHELAGPGSELAEGLRRLQTAGGASASELQPLIERAQDLEFLSRDFVSLGQLQSGELWLQHRRVDLGVIVEELRSRETDRGPRMPITLSSGTFFVEGDDARLRQAISGLLSETRARAGASDVTIDLRRDGGNAKLTISAGVGPFLATGSSDRAGVGVELARMIVQAHGGRLEHRRESVSKAVRFVMQVPLDR